MTTLPTDLGHYYKFSHLVLTVTLVTRQGKTCQVHTVVVFEWEGGG